jgi:tetratricopeptide (TPR) repeat protein
MMRRRLSFKLLIATLAGLAAVTLLVHFVHGKQIQRNAGVLLRQGERAQKADDHARAAELFNQYLRFEPDDADAVVKYAVALERSAPSGPTRLKAFLLLEQVLRREPDRLDARQQAIQFAIDLRRMPDAIRHLEYLVSTSARPGEYLHRLGWCQEAAGQYDVSAKSFRQAIAEAPGQIDSYILLAELLARHGKRPLEATRVMDAMVAANPQSSQAYLARGRSHFSHGRQDAAAADIKTAGVLGPQQMEVMLAAADMALLQGKLADAQHYADVCLQVNPKIERLYRSVAMLAVRAGQPAEAAAYLERGLKELPSSTSMRVHLAELLLDQGDAQEARHHMDLLSKQSTQQALVDYLGGRLFMLEGQWPQAIEKLTGARHALSPGSEWLSSISLSLGQCHQHLGDLEQQIGALRDAVAANSGNVAARLQLCKAFVAARHTESAWIELQSLGALPQPPAEIWPLKLRVLLDRCRRKPADETPWKEIDDLLTKVADTDPDMVEWTCLSAECLQLKGEDAKAEALLESTLANNADETRLWVALAQLQVRCHKAPQALTTLKMAQQRLGVRLEICQAMLRLWVAQPGPEAKARLGQLVKQAAELPRDEGVVLQRELAVALLMTGDKAEAEAVLRQVGTILPNDPSSRMLLLHILLYNQRDADAALVLEQLQQIEGDDGVLWRAGQASRALWHARRGDKTQLAIARQRLTEVSSRRGDWSTAALLTASLEELEGRIDQAMASYLRAITLGERQPAVVLRVARWLADLQRFHEASTILRQLENQIGLPREYAQLAAEIAIHNEEFDRAVALARKAVPATSRDHRDLLWLAQVCWLAGQCGEADSVLRQAVQSAPRVPDVWVALVGHLTRTKRATLADQVIEEMTQAIPEDRAAMTMARCLTAAGRHDQAEAAFRKLLDDNGSDLAVLRQVAEFHLDCDQLDNAETLLRRIIAPATKAPPEMLVWARRQLAILLGHQDETVANQEALTLIDKNRGPDGLLTDDSRIRAYVLSKNPESRQAAVRLFEQTLGKSTLQADERFMLIQVYQAIGSEAKANAQTRTLLGWHRDNPRYLASHIRNLLRHGATESAQSQFNFLEIIDPSSPRTQQLRAALTVRSGG